MNSTSSASAAPSKYPPTYYVNSRNLASHISRTVRLIGKVVQITPDGVRAQIEACDGGIVTVIRSMGSEMYTNKFVCITGVVQSDSTIRESVSEGFGDSFNMDNFNKVIGFMGKAPGNSPPASVPARGVFLIKDLHRSFNLYGLGKLKLPESFPFDSRNTLYSLIQRQLDGVDEMEIQDFILKTWNKIFLNGSPHDVSPEFDPKLQLSRLRNRLLKNTDEALEAGAFGVPFWRIKNNYNEVETFFGSDRFDHISKFIESDSNAKTVIKSKL